MRRPVPVVLALLLLSACTAAPPEADAPDADPSASPTTAPESGTPPRSVVLVVGDGMAAAHREAGRLDQEGAGGRLAMDSLPVAGEQTTDPDPAETDVTDSAAAATAWATGVTTRNGAISVDRDGRPLTPLGTEAGAAGLATGLVTTSQVTDATPAAFFSSVPDRDAQEDVARQYLQDTGPSVVLGGGAAHWRSGDLLGAARQQGYAAVTDAAGLAAADGDRLLGLFADEELYGEPADVSLAQMTAAALDRLSADPDGFFLLVEEEGVDSASHENAGAGLLAAMRALDDAVQVVRDHVAAHPDTLLVVTGDHETGGLGVEMGNAARAGSDGDDGPFPVAGSQDTFVLRWSTDGHTGAPTPVTAEGPGSEQLADTYPNTHLHEVMREALLG
ncbi:alkaline phosphatase [Geodermatophilus sp. SYSU D00697]